MSVEIKGVSEVLKQIERRYGREAMREKSDKALNEASDYFLNTLKKSLKVSKIPELQLMR